LMEVHMNNRLNHTPPPNQEGETILQPRLKRDEPVKVCCPKREIAGSGPHLTGETYSLLRYRLRAAAAILLIGFAAFYIRHVAGMIAGEPLDLLLLAAHTLVVLVLGLSLMPLCRNCPKSTHKLRVAELIVFGLPAAFFLLLQHRVTMYDAAHNYLPSPMPFW